MTYRAYRPPAMLWPWLLAVALALLASHWIAQGLAGLAGALP